MSCWQPPRFPLATGLGSALATLVFSLGQAGTACRLLTGLPRLLPPGVAARETAQALKTLAQAARGVAASTGDPAGARAMLDSAWDVMEGSALLIQEAKQALVSPGDAESQQRLAQVGAEQPERGVGCRSPCPNTAATHIRTAPGKRGHVAVATRTVRLLLRTVPLAQNSPRVQECLQVVL